MRITIETNDKSFYTDLKNQNIEGLTVKVVTRDSAKGVISTALLYLVIVVTKDASAVFKEWLTHRIHGDVNQCTVINGNQVNSNTVTTTNINNYFMGKVHDEKSDGEAK